MALKHHASAPGFALRSALGPRAVLAALALWLAAATGAAAQGQAEETHTLNFRNADINAFIEDVSALTGYTLIVHPEVRGVVTVNSSAQLTREEVFEVFLSTLRTYGYTAIPTSPGAYRIVPETSAAQNSGSVGVLDAMPDEFVTEVFELRHFDAAEAARMVTPLVNHRGQVTANSTGNLIIVVDYAGNIARIRALLSELDEDRTVVRTVTLVNASAFDVARLANALEDEARGGAGPRRASAAPLEGTNTLVLRGESAAVAAMRALVGELDVASAPTENLRVIPLRNARASEVVPTLEAVARTMRVSGDREIVIPFDEATNSVVLTADPQTLAALVRVVEELDIRRPQVMIEAIIVEIGDGVARDLGVHYLLAGDGDSSIPFAVSNFSRSAPNLLAITGALEIDDDGKDSLGEDVRQAALASILGIRGGAFGVGGETGDGLFGVILNALQSDMESNVLSTPHITTLNNEPARIHVGQEIPITTGEVLGASNTNPFRTIERQDVGVQLEVRPQISDGDSIQLYIRQEVSSVFDLAGPTLGEFVTNKREIETTVLADDGEIIVLGGLIEGTEQVTEDKVPLLGDVPLLGRAFSSTSRERARTNLVVFIRPTILRDAASARAQAARSLDSIMAAQSVRSGPSAERFDELMRQALGESQGTP
jgi:general secretion pathway protein D